MLAFFTFIKLSVPEQLLNILWLKRFFSFPSKYAIVLHVRARTFSPLSSATVLSYSFRCHSNRRNGDMLENTNWFAIYVWEFSVAKKELLCDLLLWPPSLSHFHRIMATTIICSTLALWLLIGEEEDLWISWLHYSMDPYICLHLINVRWKRWTTRKILHANAPFRNFDFQIILRIQSTGIYD